MGNSNETESSLSDEEDDKTYDVFHRTWWREAEPSDGRWPDNRVPCAGEKTYIARGVSYKLAREICDEWNSSHDPGRLSRKAEFEEA